LICLEREVLARFDINTKFMLGNTSHNPAM
jgi:hypothetical protein